MNWEKIPNMKRESPTNGVTWKRYEVTCGESVVQERSWTVWTSKNDKYSIYTFSSYMALYLHSKKQKQKQNTCTTLHNKSPRCYHLLATVSNRKSRLLFFAQSWKNFRLRLFSEIFINLNVFYSRVIILKFSFVVIFTEEPFQTVSPSCFTCNRYR